MSLLLGAEERFNGGSGVGIDDYLRTLSVPTADRVKAQFQKAIAAVRAIDGPLDQAMTARPLVVGRALDECRTLEILLKVEVASTLGVTQSSVSLTPTGRSYGLPSGGSPSLV